MIGFAALSEASDLLASEVTPGRSLRSVVAAHNLNAARLAQQQVDPVLPLSARTTGSVTAGAYQYFTVCVCVCVLRYTRWTSGGLI